jgi:hypothetical protein
MWRMTVALLVVVEALAQRRTVSYVTYSEAIPMLRIEAARRPKVQVKLHSGIRLRGRLLTADPNSLVLDKKTPVDFTQVEWIRFASGARQASSIDKGITAGATVGALLYMELRSAGAHAASASRVWLGATIIGAFIGSQTGRVDTGRYYVLRDDSGRVIPQPNQQLTLPLLPPRPSLPSRPQ